MAARIVGVDTTGLRKALDLAAKYSERTPEQMAATAAYFIARKTSRDAHRASMSKMDAQLGAVTQISYINKKGTGLNKRPRKTMALRGVAPGEASTAEKIVLARLWAQSKFNKLTHQRWLIDRKYFSAGQGEVGFWAKVAAVATTMVKRRHSSIAFLASSLVPVVKQVEQWVDPRYRRGAGPLDAEAQRVKHSEKLGTATLSRGKAKASVRGDLLVGTVPNVLSPERNEAMHAFVGPALQGAINDEAAKNAAYAVHKEEMLRDGAALAGAGVKVKV